MTRPGIEPRSPGPLANTLTASPMSGTNDIKDLITISYSEKMILLYNNRGISVHAFELS